MLTHSIFANLSFSKLDRLLILDLLSRLYRTSNMLSSGYRVLTLKLRKGCFQEASLEQAFEHAL